jgi:hypothetical protein
MCIHNYIHLKITQHADKEEQKCCVIFIIHQLLLPPTKEETTIDDEDEHLDSLPEEPLPSTFT